MRILVSHGTGDGPTPLAAFDSALLAAGVENYNLIRLSSVIPPGAGIERGRFTSDPDEYGRRLYGRPVAAVVIAVYKSEPWG